MDNPANQPRKAALADYLAAERTFLAWVRTGLALMGFGFVVARFGLFLQQIQALQRVPAPQPIGLSLWFGTALIAAGVAVNAFAGWRYLRLVRELDSGTLDFSRASRQAAAVAIFLALIGVAMAIYLVSVRSTAQSQAQFNKEAHAMDSKSNGIVDIPGNHSVDQTVQKIQTILKAKGVNLFALIDHSGEAEKVGLTMPPTRLLIFGNPRAGTPLMQAVPSVAIDLPLKILVWEDGGGKTWVSYNSPAYLQDRHGLPQELMPNIEAVETLAAKAAE